MSRPSNRRSFLLSVAGAAGASLFGGGAAAQPRIFGRTIPPNGITDTDTNPADRPGYGRGPRQTCTPRPPYQMCDSRTGCRTVAQDPVCTTAPAPQTPGFGSYTGITDRDGADLSGNGRGQRNTNGLGMLGIPNGPTDRDPTDAPGRGRGTGGAAPQRPYTGRSDRDPTDRQGYGR